MMFASLRKLLINSHVAAIMIAILIFRSMSFAYSALISLWEPTYRTVLFLITAVAIRGLPHVFEPYDRTSLLMFMAAAPDVLGAFVCAFAAWIVSHWVYGVGPFSSLTTHRNEFSRRSHA